VQLVAIVRMIRIIFEYIEKKKEEYGIPDNKLVCAATVVHLLRTDRECRWSLCFV